MLTLNANKANADAQSDLAQASAKNTTAQGNVDSAQTDVDTATQKVQSTTTAEQSTQAEVTQAQTEANKAQNDYDNAVKQQAQTDQAVHQAQNDLKTANQEVSEAQKAADQANVKQAQAQTNANTANQNVENANTQVQKAQGDVNDAQASVKNAENDVQTAQSHDQVVAQDQSDVQAKTDAKNKADAKVSDAQKVNNEKIEAQSNAQTAVNNAQKTVDQLSKDTNVDLSGNTHLNMAQQWINNVKNAYQDALSQNSKSQTSLDFETDALKKAFGTNIPGANKLNHYTNDPTLQAIPLKLENGRLNTTQELDATRYYLTLVNQVQQALGTPQQTITSQSLEDATKVVNQYIADNWIVTEKGHDDNALKSTRMSEAMGENYININNGPLTMNDLHKAIFDQVTNMLFNPQGDWKHAMIVANAYGQFAGKTAGVQLNFEPNSNQGGLFDQLNFHGAGVLHFLSNADTPKDAHYIAINPSQQNAVDEAGNALNQAHTNYENFVKNNQSGDLDLAHIVSQQDYQNNKAKYDADPNGAWAPTYKATVDQYNKQQAALKPYLDAIDQAQTKLDQVYFAKTSDTSKTNDHEAQLASAKQTLQDAQAKLETAKQEASQASADLASAKADAKTAADELKAAQDKLAHDSGSSMSLADAQEALKNAKAVLAQKQVNLADAKKVAQKAQTMKSQSDSVLASAKQESQAAQKALADAQAKAKSAQEKVDALTNDDQAVADAKDKLNAANQKLQVAKSNHETAQDNLTKAQSELKQAQTKLENAKDEATKAANALKDAQTKADKTKDALAKAKDNLITDNKVYGDSVAIKDQTIHVSETSKLVDPQIANPMAKDPTQSLVMGVFLQMAASKLDTIPTGTTASWSDLNTLNHDTNTVGDHSEDVLVTFPDGSTTTVKMNLHVLAAVKPSQPDTPVVNPGHETKPGDDQKPTTPSDPTDQLGHNIKPGDTTKPASKPSTEPSTTPSHEEQQPGTHTDTPTTKSNDQQPSTQPSGNQGQTKADHNVTVAPSENGSQTAVTNNNVKLVANEVGNNNTLKRSDLNNGKLPQTGNHSEAGLIGLGVASMMAMFGLISTQRREN